MKIPVHMCTEKRVERHNTNTAELSLECEIKVNFSFLLILLCVFQNLCDERVLLLQSAFLNSDTNSDKWVVGADLRRTDFLIKRGKNNEKEEK